MRVRIALAALGALTLGGCGGNGDGGNQQASASVDGEGGVGGAGGATAKTQIRPGQWEMRTEVKAITGPGVPAGAADAAKAQNTTVTTCISEEQAKNSDATTFTGKQNPNCTAEGFEANGGRISGTMTCKGENGQPGVWMAMNGTFAAERYDLDMKMKVGGPAQGMTVETRTSGRRIGECPAGTKA
ncbi:DUF3617 domain-containing protein [Allosphingosinicella deserti]|nr:DUF3617 domain-containing protein [Sphingomonas deserti]